jgi:hypothetical protein
MTLDRTGSSTFETYALMFDEVIAWGLHQGLAGDWVGLRRRLDRSRERLSHEEARQGETTLERASQVELELWARLLTEVLLPDVRHALVTKLRSADEGADLPAIWITLDIEAFAATTRKRTARETDLTVAAHLALSQFAGRPRHVRILEGLRALEGLGESKVSALVRLDGEQILAQGRLLARAINELFPPTARELLGRVVQKRFGTWSARHPTRRLNDEWSTGRPGGEALRTWNPVWSEILGRPQEADPLGTWFVPEIQKTYQEWHAHAMAEQASAKSAQARQRRADAQRERRRRNKEAQRLVADARDRQEAEARRLEEAQRQQAAMEEHRTWILEETARQHEAARAREEEAERHRRERLAAPRKTKYTHKVAFFSSTSTYKRPPHEIHRAWAEREFDNWCRRRGLSPEGVGAEFREQWIAGF